MREITVFDDTSEAARLAQHSMTAVSEAERKVRARLKDPEEKLLGVIRTHQWTGHNIPLSEAESTLGREAGLIGTDPRTVTIKSLIRRFAGSRQPLRILDLGSLEGGLSFELAREGWDVTGIEGRDSNFEKAELIRRYFDLDNLHFEQRDVKTLSTDRDGRFDAVVCCGLLYHLDDPFRFLGTLRDITSEDGLLFIDTHVAPDEAAARHATYTAQLSETVTIDADGHQYDGRWFAEPSGGSVLDQQWSAISNARSFWPTRRSLIRAIHHAGFHGIHELFGMFDIEREFALREQFSRLYIAALRQL
jgi:2-polyprenyl-3-methyl-5-hydroxy-6-metoxy-1,4-benzoquinol methylase